MWLQYKLKHIPPKPTVTTYILLKNIGRYHLWLKWVTCNLLNLFQKVQLCSHDESPTIVKALMSLGKKTTCHVQITKSLLKLC